MGFFKKLKTANTLRIVFFGVATIAVVALTVLNVYSLYQLRNTSIESATDIKKLQIEEVTDKIRYRFYSPVWDMRKVDMNAIETQWLSDGTLQNSFTDILDKVTNDPLYSDIHFILEGQNGCESDNYPVYKYNSASKQFTPSENVPQIACDGMGISSSRSRVIADDYRFNTKSTFDAHRSYTIALIDISDNSIFGHLNLMINRDYLINNVIQDELNRQFGNADESGIVVWLRDWVQNDVLLSSDERYEYDRDKYPIDLRQRFSVSMDDWGLYATILESPTIAASDASLNRNLIVMGVAVFSLLGALFFIFINAQRERDLAQRQAGFLANITHELKTPLAVMQAAGENIADGRVTDGNRLKNYGDHIYNESIRLKKMIEKLLDAAKVDSGEVQADQAPHYLQELTTEFFEANKSYIQGQGFEISFNYDDDIPPVNIDADHIETILNNLVENAIKYSIERKKIDISITKDGNFVSLTVSDKGTGIPKNSLRYIFDKFFRVEDTLTAKTKGHGLGLAIVKSMVEMNGGKIEVVSEYGKGSAFTVKFPALSASKLTEHQKHQSEKIEAFTNGTKIEEYV